MNDLFRESDTVCIHTLRSFEETLLAAMIACVRIAIHAFALKFGMVLSGINAGGNLGVDVFMSGTTAAAREASYHGIPTAQCPID